MTPAARIRDDASRWGGLRGVIGARLLLSAIALPIGVLWWPDAGPGAMAVLTAALVAVGVSTILLWLLARWRRGYRAQVVLHLMLDLALVTGLAAATGARASQFTLFYVLVVIMGGTQAGRTGGVVAALGACAAYLALPSLARAAGLPDDVGGAAPHPGMLLALLAAVGVLAGVLGSRTLDARVDLERASRELARVRVDHDTILQHLTSGVLTLDAQGRVAYLNPAAEEVLGLRAPAIHGRPAAEALPTRLAGLRDALLEALEQGHVRVRSEVTLHGPSGHAFPVGLSTNQLVHDEDGAGVVAVFQDLSAIRAIELTARRNQTLAELGALAAGIAHELRNGLKPISGSIEVLQRELTLTGENAQLMELAARESQRLNRFVTELLSYARNREVVKEPIALEEHLRAFVEGVQRDPRRGPAVSVGCAPAAGAGIVLRGDPDQLQQVWLNLAANAFEAVGVRGTVTVRAIPVGESDVAIEFEDDGSGIPAEDLPKVGQPFFTTKHGGTGLGLAIATRIVERHGGELSIDSAPGRGTRVRVTLPEAQSEMAAAA